jgi:hypothetical protein
VAAEFLNPTPVDYKMLNYLKHAVVYVKEHRMRFGVKIGCPKR